MKKLSFKLPPKNELFILAAILILGLILRFLKWPDYLPFDFEKARDLILSMQIFTERNITLLGPATEVDGVFHGALYYYLIGFFYFITGGDPRAGSIVSFGFNLFGAIVIYFIAKDIFNSKVGLISALIYAVSYEMISYSYWISNPGPAIPFIFLMFYSMYKFITTKKGDFLPLSFFCYGIIIHFQIINVVFIFPLLLLYLVSKRPLPTLKTLLITIGAFILSVSTFILFELKNNFLILRSLINNVLFYHAENAGTIGGNIFPGYFIRLFQNTSNAFFPISFWVGVVLTIILIGTVLYQIKKQKDYKWTYLLIWIFSTFPYMLVQSKITESHSAYIGVSGALTIVLAFLLYQISLKSKLSKVFTILLFLGLFSANLYAVNNYLTNREIRMFDYFQGHFLKTNLELVDYAYEDAGDQSFKTDTVTTPLFISKTWDYLFEWRGRTKYGKLPTRVNPEIGYLILEAQLGAGYMYRDLGIKKADSEVTFVSEKEFGTVFIQKRILYQNK